MTKPRFVYSRNELVATDEIVKELEADFQSFVCVVITRHLRNINTENKRHNAFTINESTIQKMYGLSAENTVIIIESEREVTEEVENQIQALLMYSGNKSRLYVINPLSKDYYELRYNN